MACVNLGVNLVQNETGHEKRNLGDFAVEHDVVDFEANVKNTHPLLSFSQAWCGTVTLQQCFLNTVMMLYVPESGHILKSDCPPSVRSFVVLSGQYFLNRSITL